MKKFLNGVLVSLAVFLVTASAMATDYTRGVVKKVNADAGKVTVIHEELKNLEMPAMTMVFRVAQAEMLNALAKGDEIEFVADRVNGKLTITEIK